MTPCDFDFCIYQEKGSCILTSSRINSLGMCANAIVIDLPATELSQRKIELLAEFKHREEEWERKQP